MAKKVFTLPEMNPEVAPMASEEMKNELKSRFEDVQNKNRMLNTQKVVNQNKLDDFKKKIVQQIFQLMIDSGVDPSDLESINRFLQALEEQDPDLKELFEYSFNALTEEPKTALDFSMSSPVGNEEGGLMNRNMAQGAMMPR